jgi:hypothetical protein
MIKFSGLHLHMVLVLAVICVVAYVFYISKDIVALDREIKMLHGKVEQLAGRLQSPSQQPPRPQQGAAPAAAQQQAKLMAQARAATAPQGVTKTSSPAPAVFPAKAAAPVPARPQAQPAVVPTPRPKVFEIADETEDTEGSEDTEETEDELTETSSADSDTAERVKEILSNVEAGAEAQVEKVEVEEPVIEVQASPAESLQKLSWTEIKDKCREMGIPIKGSNKEQLLGKLVEALKS